MNNKAALTIPDNEKLALFIKNYKMIKDLQQTYENSKQTIFDLLTEQVQLYLGDDWIVDFSSSKNYQIIRKFHWWSENPPIRVFYCYFFDRDVLLTENFYFSVLVQGYGDQWQTAPEIKGFVQLFSPRFPSLKNEYKQFDFRFLPPNEKSFKPSGDQAIVWKKYQLDVDVENIELLTQQICQPLSEVKFIIKPVEETLEEFILKFTPNKL